MTTPVDHLADKSGYTVDLLRELSDEQLREQAEYYRHRQTTATTTGEGPYQSAAYARYRHGNHEAMVVAVLAERHGGPTIEEREAEIQRQEAELGL